MEIINRFKELGLPADQCVVIGGGVIDALGLRPTNDIDLAVSGELYAELRSSGRWTENIHPSGDRFLTKDDTEVWLDWGKEPWLSFESLWQNGITIDDVRFAHPETVLKWKQQKNRPKDQVDIELLMEYLK